jgi:hypothetical protein
MKHLFFALLLLCTAAPSYAATCKVTEYRAAGTDSFGVPVLVGLEPPVATQNVTYTTPTASAALNSATHFVRVVCDAKAHFKVTVAGTAAAATDPFLPANLPEYFAVRPNFAYRISFYDGTS